MIRKLFFLFLLHSGIVNAQKFDIPAEDFPFYQVVEWKGSGALLLNRDPSLKINQVHMTNVQAGPKSVWQQAFNPLNDNYFMISEDGGRYVYFLNDLELKDGKISFNQLNASGNIKTSTVVVSSLLKRLGSFGMDDLTITEIITTEKALVYLLTHLDKSANKKTTIALTMTHHNLMAYAAILAENVTSSSKAEDQVSWYVAGVEGESVVYAARVHAGKTAGWVVKQYTPKGEFEKEYEIRSAGLSFASHIRTGFGAKGSTLLKVPEPGEQGTLLYIKGKFYAGGIETTAAGAEIATYEYGEKSWQKLNSSVVSGYNPKKPSAIGFFPMKEGIAWYNAAAKEAHFHSFAGGQTVVTKNIAPELNNPSRLITPEFTGKFVAALPTGMLVFDPAQLPVKGALTFEFIQK